MARRSPTIGHSPMHRTLPETSPVVLALVRGLNPPVTPALASSAPAAGPIFYHFRATERHLLPTHQPLAAPATLRDGTLECGLLAWICARIDEYPLAAPSFSKRDRAPGARSDCTRERRRVAGFRSLWRVVAVRRSGPCDARRTQTLGWNGLSQHGKPTPDPRLNG